MRKLLILSLAALFVTALAAADEPPEELLPIGMTPEEMGRMHEIGTYQMPTAPPTGAIRNPSEWEPSQGVIIRYPFGISYSLIAELAADLELTTIVASTSEKNTVVSNYLGWGIDTSHCNWVIAPTNSIWTRDYGPWFIFEDNGDMGIVDHDYNRPRPYDDLIPGVIGGLWGLNVYTMDLISTGGNHMSDGLGCSMSTRLVWDENPSLSHAEVDSIMQAYLGNEYTVLEYIESGGIHHIDCWAKFLNPTTILVKDVPSSWTMHDLLDARAEWLSQQISPWGVPYTIHRIYCPSGTAYTNSIILNNKVFVPLFNSSSDAAALQTYEDIMPGYEIHGFTGSFLDDDAIHCRTMGVPDSNMLYIHHVPLTNQTDTLNPYLITATIVDHSDAGLIADSLKIFYSLDGGAFNSAPMTSAGGDVYTGYIPAQAGVGEVRYYLQAADYSGRVEMHPYIGEPWAHTFGFDLPPNMEIDETSFSAAVQPGESSTDSLHIHNYGPGILRVTFETAAGWIGITTSEQTIAPSESLVLPVSLNGSALQCGGYNSSLTFTSNDPVSPSGSIPVDFDIYCPQMDITETSLGDTLAGGESSLYSLTVENNGPGRLDFQASCQMLPNPAAPAMATVVAREPIGFHEPETDKGGDAEPVFAPSGRGLGGPDTFGHFWADSDEAGGPTYDWIDISSVGTSVTLGDDDATSAIPIGFAFPFYDSVYTDLYIGSNGVVAFDEAMPSRSNVPLPDDNYTAFIAMFWDDLDPRKGGDIYYYYDAAESRFVVSFEAIKFYYSSSGTGSLTFQVVLTPDGDIKLNYGYMYAGVENLESASIGIQNSAADDALEVLYNSVYVHSDMAIAIWAEQWLSVTPAGGSIDPMGSVVLQVALDATELDDGDYSGYLTVVGNDPLNPEQQLPVTLLVSSASWICGDINGSGGEDIDIADLVYLVAYMFDGGPPPPVLAATDVDGSGSGPDIADLVYLVAYMFQAGPAPACP